MPVPLGYKAKIGWIQETDWGSPPQTGTYTGVPFLSEGLKPNFNRARIELINSFRGRLDFENPLSNASVSGDVEVPFYDVNPTSPANIPSTTIALPLWYAFGNYSYTTGAGEQITTLTFDTNEVNPANEANKGISFVVDRNVKDASNTSQYFQYVGCRINELTITGEENNIVRLRFGVVGKLEQLITTPPTINIPFPLYPFKFWFSVVKLSDGTPVEVNCRSFEITINNNYVTDRFFNNVHPQYPFAVLVDLPAGEREVTGNIELKFDDIKWYNKIINDEAISITIQIASNRITSGARMAEISIPKAVLTGETPTVSGRGPLNLRLNFQAVTDSPSTPEISLTFKTS